jgi:toxin-antitoxin system PIN domain toxin
MYLVDANVLVYATDAQAPQHDAARGWLDAHLAMRPRYVGLPWPSILAYLRLVTNPRIYSPPAPVAEAWQRAEEWLARPAAWVPVPGSRHTQLFDDIVSDVRPAGNLVPDAHLAALAQENGLTVVSTDSDFAKFRYVAWLDPVTGKQRRPSPDPGEDGVAP